MNTKYAKNPNPNPNEPKLFGFARVILSVAEKKPALSLSNGRPASKSLTPAVGSADSTLFLIGRKIKNLNPVYPVNPVKKIICAICEICGSIRVARTNPIFSRPNMRYQYQKHRNGGQKLTQKNETNPIVDNFRRSAAKDKFSIVDPWGTSC